MRGDLQALQLAWSLVGSGSGSGCWLLGRRLEETATKKSSAAGRRANVIPDWFRI